MYIRRQRKTSQSGAEEKKFDTQRRWFSAAFVSAPLSEYKTDFVSRQCPILLRFIRCRSENLLLGEPKRIFRGPFYEPLAPEQRARVSAPGGRVDKTAAATAAKGRRLGVSGINTTGCKFSASDRHAHPRTFLRTRGGIRRYARDIIK